MFEVVFSQESIENIQSFVRSYEGTFVRRFSDSGLWSVETILEQYRSLTNDLYVNLKTSIISRLEIPRVLGRKKTGKLLRISFSINDFFIIVRYKESLKEKARYVEALFVNKL